MPETGWRRDAITVDLSGYDVIVPYRSAADWLDTLDGNPVKTLLALVRESVADSIMNDLAAGETTGPELAKAAYSLFEQAIPFKWWESYRLLLTSQSRETMGRLALAGLDPSSMSVGVWTCATYALLTKGADAKDKAKFDGQLSIPPDGVEDDWEDESFDAMVAQARAMPGMR